MNSHANPICGFTLKQRAEVAASLFGTTVPVPVELARVAPRASWSVLSVRDLVVWFVSLPFKNGRKPSTGQVARVVGLCKQMVWKALKRVREWQDGAYAESLIMDRIWARDSSPLPITQTLAVYRDLRRSLWKRGGLRVKGA